MPKKKPGGKRNSKSSSSGGSAPHLYSAGADIFLKRASRKISSDISKGIGSALNTAFWAAFPFTVPLKMAHMGIKAGAKGTKMVKEAMLNIKTSKAVQAISSLASTVIGLATNLKFLVTAFLGFKAVQAVFNNMISIEGQIIRLQTAMQDATLGAQEFRKAMQFASVTPFPVEQVTQAAVMLRVFQFDPFKEIDSSGRNLMTLLGDMAGAMGRDIALAAHALNRAMVAEWEVMQNNFQVSARMIPKLKGLASGTKEYGDAIIEFLAKQDRFRGGMELTAKSVVGMISNIKDAITIMTTGFTGVADSVTGFQGLTMYDDFKSQLKTLYSTVTDKSILTSYSQQLILLEDMKDSLKNLVVGSTEYYNKIKKIREIEAQMQESLTEASDKFNMSPKIIKNLAEMRKQMLDMGLSEQEIRVRLAYLAPDASLVQDQFEKIENIGRVFGVTFGRVVNAAFTGTFTGLSNSLLNYLDSVVKNTLNSFVHINTVASHSLKAVQTGAAIAADDITGFIEASNSYLMHFLSANTQESQEAMQKIREAMMANQDPFMKQMQVYMILIKLFFTMFMIKMQQFFNNTPLGVILKKLWDWVVILIENVGYLVDEILFGLWVIIGDIIDVFNDFLDIFDIASTEGEGFAFIMDLVSVALQGVGSIIRALIAIIVVVVSKVLRFISLIFRFFDLVTQVFMTVFRAVKLFYDFITGKSISSDDVSNVFSGLKDSASKFGESWNKFTDLSEAKVLADKVMRRSEKSVDAESNIDKKTGDYDKKLLDIASKATGVSDKNYLSSLSIGQNFEAAVKDLKVRGILDLNNVATTKEGQLLLLEALKKDNVTNINQLKVLEQIEKNLKNNNNNKNVIINNTISTQQTTASTGWSSVPIITSPTGMPSVVPLPGADGSLGITPFTITGSSSVTTTTTPVQKKSSSPRKRVPGLKKSSSVPSFNVGTFFVPDNMFAFIHKGEMIIPPREASIIRNLLGFPSVDKPAVNNLDVLLEAVRYSQINLPTPGVSGTGSVNNVKNLDIKINQVFNGSGAIAAAPKMYDAAKELAYELDYAIASS